MADFPLAASDGIRVGRRAVCLSLFGARRGLWDFGGSLRSIIVGIYRQKWVAAAVMVAWCGHDAADRYIAPVGESGSIDVYVPP